MKKPLQVLLIEDNPDDAALLLQELERGNYAVTYERVETAETLRAALGRTKWDVVFCDFTMPQFSGSKALQIVRAHDLALSFIYVSGTMGEATAVEAMQAGAHDYVMKNNLARLLPALERELLEVQVRKHNCHTERLLRLRTHALEAAANAIVIVDRAGHFQWVNLAFSELTGYGADEVIGKSPRLLKSGLHESGFYAEMWKTVRAGKVWRGEMTNRRKNGSLYPQEITITPVCNAVGEITDFVGIMTDMTEKKRLEAQCIETQKMEVIGQLAGGVAHDFNNILAVIMGYSDLMMQELPPADPLRKPLDEIRHASQRAAGLTRQLLIFSRKQTVQPVVLDLNETVKDLDKMLRRLIDENVELTVDLAQQTGRVKADPGYVGQVLMNLVVNARDAMPDGGKLTIATNNVTFDENYAHNYTGVMPGDYVMLSVIDTGIGMTDEVKARLFEAFFTTKPKGKGTGLGLSTCQTIVQQSGGHIEVSSQIGKGTTFKVYFPRVEQPLEVAAGPIRTGPLPRGTETLLVVEDDQSVRHLAGGVLQSLGYEVLSAANGQEALRVAREHKGSPINLVVTDVVMPLMGGKVMAEWLMTTYPDLKILFTSGYTDDAIAQHGVLEPGVAFLSKPYTPATLACKVRAMLDNQSDSVFLRKHDVATNLSPPDAT